MSMDEKMIFPKKKNKKKRGKTTNASSTFINKSSVEKYTSLSSFPSHQNLELISTHLSFEVSMGFFWPLTSSTPNYLQG